MVKQAKEHFEDNVVVSHSDLSEGGECDEWRRTRHGGAQIVVGARSAIFTPLKSTNLMVVDEEHGSPYKQDDTPRYRAGDVALLGSKFRKCPVVLGSTTLSLVSRARAQKERYESLLLARRANRRPLPKVDLIDLKAVEFTGVQFDLSVPSVDVTKEKIAKREQVVLLPDRRGFTSSMLCRSCNFVLKCPNCDVSLTLHRDTQQMQYHCHGHKGPTPGKCPKC